MDDYSKKLDLKRYREVKKNLDDMSKDSTKQRIDMASLSSEDIKELYSLSEDTKREKIIMVCVTIIFTSAIILSGVVLTH